MKTFKDYATDWKAIYGIMLIVATGGVWAADTVFQTDNEATNKQIKMLEYQKQDLETEKGYAESQREKEKIEALIRNKDSQIKQLNTELK